jgi:hypothetical protein
MKKAQTADICGIGDDKEFWLSANKNLMAKAVIKDCINSPMDEGRAYKIITDAYTAYKETGAFKDIDPNDMMKLRLNYSVNEIISWFGKDKAAEPQPPHEKDAVKEK